MTRSMQDFLDAAGWSKASVAPLAGDASSRSYHRLTAKSGCTAVLMDAGQQAGAGIGTFTALARFLGGLGLSAPDILHEDRATGFLLIEDLGDRLFAREITQDPAREMPLYLAALDVLAVLRKAAPPQLPAFDAAVTVPMTDLAFDWYLPAATGAGNGHAKARFFKMFHPLVAAHDPDCTVFAHRDFHAENLLWLPDRDGVARVGLLDFQDAVRGHRVYDLVSLLQDARRDVSAEVAEACKAAFVAQTGQDRDAFDLAYATLGLQRNLRILGIFARLCLRDGKAHYVDLLPRVWGYVQDSLAHPALAALSPLVTDVLPAPSADILNRLKGQRGQWAGR